MEAIELKPELRESLEQVAQQQSSTINALVNQAVEDYLREQQRAKLDGEIAAFEAMYSDLRQKHLGEWVAVHQANLIDYDRDLSALYRRVRAKYGKISVLIRQVTSSPTEEVWLRTPSTQTYVLCRPGTSSRWECKWTIARF